MKSTHAPSPHPPAASAKEPARTSSRLAAPELHGGRERDPMPSRERELELHELREEFVEERARIIGDEQRRALQWCMEALASAQATSPAAQSAAIRTFEKRVRLEAIETALEAFAQCTYGECPSCGGPIELPRLRAHPNADCCEACETPAGSVTRA